MCQIDSLGFSSQQTLDLSSCQNVSQVGLSSLTSGTECLQHLTLAYGSAVRFPEFLFSVLFKQCKLISPLFAYHILCFQVTLDIAHSLQKLSKLQSIKLDGCLVTSSGLQAIGNCCSLLRELSLSKCSGVTDEGLTSIVKQQKGLRKLDITCCRNITYVSIAHIANSCTSLVSLRMESCTLVPREAFVLIGQRCLLLEELDLTDNEIDDEGLIYSLLSLLREGYSAASLQLPSLCRFEVHLELPKIGNLETWNLLEHNR